MGVIPHTPGEYPRYVFHSSKPPVMVHSKEEHMERRSQGYVDTYVEQSYPCHMYKNQHTRTVKSEAEEKSLRAKGWSRKPGDHQLTTNHDGSSVPEENRWLQGPEDLDDEDAELADKPVNVKPKRATPRAKKAKPAAATTAAADAK